MQRLNSGSGVRVQLVVPGNCLYSLQTTNVTVTHLVGAMLVTPDCMAAPCIWTPLSVLPLLTGTGPAAMPGAAVSIPDLPRNTTVPLQSVPDLQRSTAQQYSAGSYGPYPNNSPPPYGSTQTAPYPQNNPPPGATYGSAQGRVPDMPYPSQQPIPYATAVGMKAYGNVTPGL